MASQGLDDRTVGVARVYADALLALAVEAGRADEVRDELDGLAAVFGQGAGARDFLVSPAIDADERARSLEKALRGRASDLVVDTLLVMNRKGRLGLLPALVVTYREAHDELRRRIEVRVTSAVPLAEPQRRRLAEAIESSTGRRPTLLEKVDPGILGGLVVHIGDDKADASIATRLDNLSEALRARAARRLREGSHVEGMVE